MLGVACVTARVWGLPVLNAFCGANEVSDKDELSSDKPRYGGGKSLCWLALRRRRLKGPEKMVMVMFSNDWRKANITDVSNVYSRTKNKYINAASRNKILSTLCPIKHVFSPFSQKRSKHHAIGVSEDATKKIKNSLPLANNSNNSSDDNSKCCYTSNDDKDVNCREQILFFCFIPAYLTVWSCFKKN